MAGDQPSDDQEPAGQPGGVESGADPDAPQLPVDPIDPAATPLPAGTPPFPPIVSPAPPPATIELTASTSTPTSVPTPAADAVAPAAGTAPPAPDGPGAGQADAGGDTPDADVTQDPAANPGHTIRTLVIAIVALVVLLGVGVLAMQKFGSEPSSPPQVDGGAGASTPAAASATAPAGPAVTVRVVLLSSTDDTARCPGVARLMGTITVAGGPTDITYRWTHSDGRDSDIRTVRVDGTAQVTQDWEHPGKATFLGQTQLEVISPETAKSTALTISGSCTPASVSPTPSN